ncbi:MAG: alpha/beta hydrolase [Sandaracinaceae bacterium]|nr:alpha/beta hydrolase [Sandaracinaceae bacterium]
MTPQSPLDPEVRQLVRERGVTTYTDEGTSHRPGDALVMVHGLPGSVRDYRWLESALRETPQGSLANLRVVRLDMPGLGGTDLRLADAHDVTSRARFVLETLDALGLERVVLVGHSMGGGVTLTAAALSRKRAGCAVVGVCQVASVGNRPHKAYLRMPNPRPVGVLLKLPGMARALQKPIYDSFVRGGFPASTPVNECVQALRCVAALRFETLVAAAHELGLRPLPALVTFADDDPMVEPEVGEALVEALSAEELRFVEGGHNIQKTQAVEIAEGLVRLCERAFGVPKELRKLG